MSEQQPQPKEQRFEPTLTLEGLRHKIADFADERNWNQYHTPRNLLLAMTGEVGELCECFQWRNDEGQNPDTWTAADREHLGEELSDVLIYLIRLADRCNVDLSAAALDKIKKNAIKYPAAKVHGSSLKYTAYATGEGTTDDKK
ncbi:XTP3-transactivated A protein [Achlya hypogyna]|uniref:dCTP pyrophosphatase 1 n=1 Tax=Achlya hypogyna TaxID=1202772 RepID=A0A1V9Z624_ACHHY|nr:XTP3-transactivated A protein [Achlya hypogyna]